MDGGAEPNPKRLKLPASNDVVETSRVVSDAVKCTTCYMCACRCGIRVHLKDGRIRYIEGNRNHPVNRGVLCAKGSAGIMQQYSPAKLAKPLLRVGERGSGDFREIEWDEALALATQWLGDIRATDPKKLAFFTGRDQSQSLTGWWAAQFGTPNFAAHGGFCSVNMAAAGLYSIGGSFWEFGEPDWERTKYFVMFGVAEDHDSNPIKLGVSQAEGARRQVRVGEPDPDRLLGGGGRMGGDPAGHGRAAGDGADPRAAARRQDRPGFPGALHQRAVAGGEGAGRGGGRAVRARRRGPAAVLGRQAQAGGQCAGRGRFADDRRRGGAAGWPQGGAGLPARRRALSRPALRARCGCQELRRAGRDDQAHRRRAGAGGVRAGDRAAAAVDRLGRAAPRDDGGAAGGDARDARHLGAFERLPHLPRDPRAADAAGRDRYAGVVALQGAVPAAVAARAQAGRQGGGGGPAAGRHAARQPDRARGPAARAGRDADAHRQGVFVGGAAGGPRPDAHGDPQRLGGGPVQDRHPVHVHGEHGVELGDEHRRHDRHADRQGGGRLATRSRASSTPTRTTRRWSPTPTWCCPTRPTWSAGTASRCSTGRSARPRGRPTRSASRCSSPTATCGRSRTCCSSWGHGSGCRA